MEYKELIISEEYLQELIDHVGSSIVGKLMKRFELLGSDHKSIKLEAKELIYEGMRDLRNLIHAHNEGRNITIFKFKKEKHLTKDSNQSK